MTDQPLLHYKSLDDIRARKQALRKELDSGSQSMKTQWNSLFHAPKRDVPSRRITTFMTTSASVFDGILLAWKLYNRLGGSKRQSKKKKSLLARILG